MRVVTRLTGLNADTIRAWERRYGAIEPPRTEGNTRLFKAEDIERLNHLRDLVALGHAIGTIANLPTSALVELRRLDRSADQTDEDGLAGLRRDYLEAIGRFEARRGLGLLQQVAAHLPARDFVFRVALPILREVGQRWSHWREQESSPSYFGVAHEHLAAAQLRAVLTAFQHLHPSDRGAPRILVTTPAGHLHEFGILIGALLAQLRGFEVIYLGVDLPSDELILASRKASPALVLLGVAYPVAEDVGRELEAVARAIGDKTELWLGLPPPDTFASPHIRRFTSFEQLDLALIEHRR